MVAGPLTQTQRRMAEAGIVALIGAATALLDPTGIGDGALGARLIVWIGGFLAAWLVYGLLLQVGHAAARLLGLAEGWGYVLTLPFSTMAVAFAVLALAGGPEAMFGAGFARVWLQSLMIGAGICALFYVLYARAESMGAAAPATAVPAVPAPPPPPPPGPAAQSGVAISALHGRLAPGFPPILALAAEDHYVRVIAEGRSALVLMTLAEAAALMPEGSGAQVHRSWWVARSAVTGQQRGRRDLRLVLAGGLTAPVSRSRSAALRAAGWFSP